MRRHQVRLFLVQLMARACAKTLWWELPAVSRDLREGLARWWGGMVGTEKHGVRWAGTELVGRHRCILSSGVTWFDFEFQLKTQTMMWRMGGHREPRAEARRPVRRQLPGSEREREMRDGGLGPGWRWRCEAGDGSCSLVVESPPGWQVRFQDLVERKEQLVLRFLT